MKRQRMGTDGLSMFESVVLLAIAAALAGVLLPSLSTQLRKGQVDRVVTDVHHLRASATTFFSEITRYPGDMEDLASQITDTDSDVRAAAYPTKLRARWAGPYLDGRVADGDSLSTGFGGVIHDDFTVNQNSNGVDYLTVLTTGISAVEFAYLDRALDEGNGASAGRLRLSDSGDTLKFYALPLQ